MHSNSFSISRCFRRAHGDYRNFAATQSRSYPLDDLKSVALGEVQIQNEKLRDGYFAVPFKGFDERNRVLSILSPDEFKVDCVLSKSFLDDQRIGVVVLGK